MALIPSGEGGAIVAWDAGAPPDGFNETVFVQRLSRAGVRAPDRDDERQLERAAVGVGPPEFSLLGFVPNPARHGAASIAFSLLRDSPVRVELFDIQGRRVARQEVGELGAGMHQVRIEAGRVLPAGVYFITLTSRGRSLTARGIIVN